MDDMTLSDAAATVVTARLGRQRLQRLADVTTLGDGYVVQQRANALLEGRLGPRVGHKIGGTTESMRRYINVPEPLAGEVFASQVHADGASVRRDEFVRLGIETEIAVRLARDLPPRPAPYTRGDVALAVAACMASIELVDDRYDDFATIGGPTQIADNAFDAGVVLGRPRPDWQGLDLAALTAPHLARRCAPGRGPQRRAAGPPLGRSGLARHQTLQPGAGVGRRHLRQPGHDHAGAVGRRPKPLPGRGGGAGRGRGDRGLKQRNGGPAAAKRSVCRCRRLLAGAGQA